MRGGLVRALEPGPSFVAIPWNITRVLSHLARPCSILADGRFAVVGGRRMDGSRRADGEVYNSVTGVWAPLAGEMVSERTAHTVVAVAGGMVATGGDQKAAAAELYDAESGR